MANILIRNLSFHYRNPHHIVFDNISLNVSTNWKTGLIGKSGSGKSTLLKLVTGKLDGSSGSVSPFANSVYFPFKAADESRSAHEVIKDCIAPFDKWKSEMKTYLSKGDSDSLFKYEETIGLFEENNGENIDVIIKQEAEKIGLESERLKLSFYSLRDGEKSRALLLALFIKKNIYPVIDDISSSLNLCEREYVADYLSNSQKGFLISSSDRFLLNTSTNHIIAIDNRNVRTNRGNYSVFKLQIDLENNYEEKDFSELIGIENDRYCLNDLPVETNKGGSYSTGNKLFNKRNGKLKSFSSDNFSNKSDAVLLIEDLTLKILEKVQLKNFSHTLHKGDRTALIDRKGFVGSLLLKTIEQKIDKFSGEINILNNAELSIVNKNPSWVSGYLLQYLIENKISPEQFRKAAKIFQLKENIFESPLETLSMNDLKLLEICRAFCYPENIQLWNLPLHFLDIDSRELLEKILKDHKLTILFTENDRFFINNISTEIINLPS